MLSGSGMRGVNYHTGRAVNTPFSLRDVPESFVVLRRVYVGDGSGRITLDRANELRPIPRELIQSAVALGRPDDLRQRRREDHRVAALAVMGGDDDAVGRRGEGVDAPPHVLQRDASGVAGTDEPTVRAGRCIQR